ncbi:MAG: MFS transporter [Ponticaulis sp.]|nr:MFS transporter [Ponticaulis sp.]|tara:strand:+ start:8896 stop:10314 length:1419 start_codon:yes stop_codon:yes gene_type:complete
MSSTTASEGNGHLTGFGTKGYRTYVLLTLTIVYTLNFVDRILITVVGRPIIDEFQLSNFQFGILTGFAFALLYTLLGIPIAIASERINRVRIIGACVILWSVATILCGFAVGFATLLAARVLVGIGEAGCTPPANSIISDYYKPSSRATALGIYAMGVTAGGLLAQLFGGSLLKFFSWREAFIFVGAPGVLIGLLLLFTVKEPPRGYSEPPTSRKTDSIPIPQALREIITKPTFWIMSAGATIAAFAGYALIGFQPLYIQYVKGVSVSDTALLYMAPLAVAGSAGAFLGGWLTELASKKHPTAICWVPGLAHLLCAPIYAYSFVIGGLIPMLIFMAIAAVLQYFYLGSQYNIAQSVVSVRVRATSVAILLFIVNLIGYGAGPPFFGFLADMFTNNYLASMDLGTTLDASCSLTEGGDELIASCLEGKAFGIRWANFSAAGLFAVAGVFFLLSGMTFKRDAETVTGPADQPAS